MMTGSTSCTDWINGNVVRVVQTQAYDQCSAFRREGRTLEKPGKTVTVASGFRLTDASLPWVDSLTTSTSLAAFGQLSWEVTEGPHRAPARAMLCATGRDDAASSSAFG